MPDIQTTLREVLKLNSSEHPFKYEVTNSTIVGKWDITNSRWFAPGSVTDIIEKYSLTIRLDESKGKFSTSETKLSSNFNIGLSSNGTLHIGGESDSFFGSLSQKTIQFGVGGEKDGSNNIGINSIKFDTNEIKKTLFSLLRDLGWKKKGIFG